MADSILATQNGSNIVAGFHYPADTEISTAGSGQIYTVTECAYAADYPKR